MDTWERRGFAAAVIAGRQLGLSGTGGWSAVRTAGATAPPQAEVAGSTSGSPDMRAPRQPMEPPRGPGYRTGGEPGYQPGPPGGFQPRQPGGYQPGYAAPRMPQLPPPPMHQTSPVRTRHGHRRADERGYVEPMEPRVSPESSGHESLGQPERLWPTERPAQSGSGGYLAGNVAALAGSVAPDVAGSAIGAIGVDPAPLGAGVDPYATGGYLSREPAGASSRHARPENDELFTDGSSGSAGLRYATDALGAYPVDANSTPVSSLPDLETDPGGQRAQIGRASHAAPEDTDGSALGSLDSSGLFGSLRR